MATVSPDPGKGTTLPVRLSPEDLHYLKKLQRKLGGSYAQIVRMALRRLADRLDLLDSNYPENL